MYIVCKALHIFVVTYKSHDTNKDQIKQQQWQKMNKTQTNNEASKLCSQL